MISDCKLLYVNTIPPPELIGRGIVSFFIIARALCSYQSFVKQIYQLFWKNQNIPTELSDEQDLEISK